MTWHKEQPGQREAEQRVADNIEKAWRCKLVKLKNIHSADYAAIVKDKCLDERVAALIEIKCRSVSRDHYPTAIADINKCHKIDGYRQILHDCQAFLFYQWTDQCGYIEMLPPYRATFMGRQDRGEDERDLYVQFPVADFKTIWRGQEYVDMP